MTENEKYLDNPCGKLFMILEEIRRKSITGAMYDRDKSYKKYINSLINIHDSDSLSKRKLLDVKNLLFSKYFDKILKYLEEDRIEGAELCISTLREVENIILNLPLNIKTVNDIVIEENLLKSLKYCSVIYSNSLAKDMIMNDEDMKKINEEIVKLYANIDDFPFDNNYKEQLLEIVKKIANIFKEYNNYVDKSEAEKHLNELIGSIFSHLEKWEKHTEEEINKMSNIMNTIKVITQVLTPASMAVGMISNALNINHLIK